MAEKLNEESAREEMKVLAEQLNRPWTAVWSVNHFFRQSGAESVNTASPKDSREVRVPLPLFLAKNPTILK